LVADGTADPTYATGFIRSLARASGDLALETAALQSRTEADRSALAVMLEARLMALQPAS
jgi:hypothetical protein